MLITFVSAVVYSMYGLTWWERSLVFGVFVGRWKEISWIGANGDWKPGALMSSTRRFSGSA